MFLRALDASVVKNNDHGDVRIENSPFTTRLRNFSCQPAVYATKELRHKAYLP